MPAGKRDHIHEPMCHACGQARPHSQANGSYPHANANTPPRPMWLSTLTGSDKSNEMAKRPLSCMKIAFHLTNPPKWHEEKMERRFISATAGASPSASSSPSQETPVRNCSVHELLNASHALRALLCRKARSRNGLVVPFRQIWHLEPLSRAATSRFCQERQFGRKRRRRRGEQDDDSSGKRKRKMNGGTDESGGKRRQTEGSDGYGKQRGTKGWMAVAAENGDGQRGERTDGRRRQTTASGRQRLAT